MDPWWKQDRLPIVDGVTNKSLLNGDNGSVPVLDNTLQRLWRLHWSGEARRDIVHPMLPEKVAVPFVHEKPDVTSRDKKLCVLRSCGFQHINTRCSELVILLEISV